MKTRSTSSLSLAKVFLSVALLATMIVGIAAPALAQNENIRALYIGGGNKSHPPQTEPPSAGKTGVAKAGENLQVNVFQVTDPLDPQNTQPIYPAYFDFSPYITLTIGNQGDAITTPFVVRLEFTEIFSPNRTFLVAETVVNGIGAAASGVPVQFDVAYIPYPDVASSALGNLTVYLDYENAIAETSEADNSISNVIGVTSAETANLEVVEFSTTQTDLPRAQSLGPLVTLRVRNNSPNGIPGNTFRVDLLRSPDAVVDSTDIYFTSFMIAEDILPGQILDIDLSAKSIPYNTPLGATFLGVMLDRGNNVFESNENDNDGIAAINVIENPTAECVYSQDFQEGESNWTTSTPSAGIQDIFWNRTSYDDQGTLRGVWWCGTTNQYWVSPIGYGNDWDQTLTKSFALPTGGVTLSYSMQHSTEPGYDYARVEIYDAFQQIWVSLAARDGDSGGFVTYNHDLSAYAGQTVELRFRFTSDSGWSDEDGSWITGGLGACRLDWVQVTGFPVDDFESSDGGWVAGVPASTVDFSYRLEETPLCVSSVLPDYDCNYYVSGEPAVTCNAWVAYDPITGEYPFRPQQDVLDGTTTEIAIVSPVFTAPVDATTFVLVFDIFQDLPLDSGVFYRWGVSSPAGNTFQDLNFVYYGISGGWNTVSYDVSQFVVPGSTMQIQLSAWDGGHNFGFPGTEHTVGPMFDNIRLLAFNGNGDGTSCPSPRECGSVTVVADADRDGVPDEVDLCPSESAVPFDRDGDGCPDKLAGARHIEYWDESEFPLHYLIQEDGAPGVGASAFTEVQAALDAWGSDPLTEVSFVYDGTTPQQTADALDGVNLVTFTDVEFPFPSAVLAVGLSTSFEEPAEFQGRLVRPGQIVDFDLIFNPDRAFRTDTEGPATGSDIRAVATHEAGHALGMAHSSIASATMFYVLPEDTQARSLELDDAMAMRKAYPAANVLDTQTRIVGQVVADNDGVPLPVPGVIVFAHSITDLTRVACEYTLPDGSFQFLGLPAGDYYISIHGLDGSESIGFIQPGNINQLIANTAITTIVPEFYDSAESKSDQSDAMSPVTAAVYTPPAEPTPITIVLNEDEVGPLATAIYPTAGLSGVAIDAPVRIRFDEAIDTDSISGNFRLTRQPGGEFVSGNAAVFENGTLLSFVPSSTFAFATSYRIEVLDGITDIFANPLQAPLTVDFTTQAQPAVSISSLSPSQGVVGTIVVAAGAGFEAASADNEVRIDGTPVPLLSADAGQVVFEIPAGLPEGSVSITVTNTVSGITSNPLNFTVIAPLELARGFEADAVSLSGTPWALSLARDGSKAFMATSDGFACVDVDVSSSQYLTQSTVSIPGGLSDLDETPDAGLVFAVSKWNQKVYRINTGSDGNPIAVLAEHDLEARPLGILIGPAGRRAFIPTDDAGRIIVWDVNESSPTFDQPLGVLVSSDPNLRGKMDTDPTGSHLYLLTGTGKLLDYDLEQERVVDEVRVGLDPEDLVVDGAGSRAYVSTGDGHVAIVDLSTLTRDLDVRAGGTLLGIDIAAAGSFVYAVNHDLDKLDIIDLQPTSPALLTVATRIDQQPNPLDVELSRDGLYAYSIVESSQQLVVNAIGIGPALGAQSLRAGPVGSKLVLSGRGLDDDAFTRVSFGGVTAVPDRLADGSLTVTVPPGASSGSVIVVGTNGTEQTSVSNALSFEVLGPTQGSSLRLAGSSSSTIVPAADGGSALARSVAGDLLALTDLEGGFYAFDVDPTSRSFRSFLGGISLADAVSQIALTPDGQRAFLLQPSAGEILVIDANRRSPGFLGQIGSIDLSGLTGPAGGMALDLSGRQLLVIDPDGGRIHLADVDPESPGAYSFPAPGPIELTTAIGEIAMHPDGSHAYLCVPDAVSPRVLVLDLDPSSASYRQILASSTVPLPGTAIPTRLGFTPDGSRCVVLTRQETGPTDRSLVLLDTSTPTAAIQLVSSALGISATPAPDDLSVSPRGDRVVVSVRDTGLFNYEIQTAPDALSLVEQTGDPIAHSSSVEIEHATDGTHLYVLSESADQLLTYDYLETQSMAIVSGNGQSGVVNTPLPGELRVLVSSASGPTQGVPVTFTVVGGSGSFTLSGLQEQTVLTDAAGVADLDFSLGPELGTQIVSASSFGVVNSPLSFTLDALQDPETIPMTVVSVTPGNGAVDVNLSSAIQVVFSRAVDTGTVRSTTVQLLQDGITPVPVRIGFADGNRRISLTPSSALASGTGFVLLLSGVTDASGGALVGDPYGTSFTTTPPLPLSVDAISPPSAVRNTPVTIAGRSFEPGANIVRFGTVEGVISSESATSITVVVPLSLDPGSYPVTVQTSTESSAPISFNVLQPKTTPVDDVIASSGTGSTTRSVAISPDGTLAYAVSPDANLVVPITLGDASLSTLPAIPVGQNPFAVIVHPDGNSAYVTNLLSGSVSVIDTDPSSPQYHTVVEEIGVGTGPMDLVFAPDGDRLIVANAGSQDLSVIDSDGASSTFNQVLSTTSTGSTTRSVAISPDGTRLYAGTESGYIVLDTIDFGVISSVNSGSSTRQVAISPDGTLLVVLTTEGQIVVFDVAPGSDTEDRVIASSGSGSTTRSVAISPDGTLLYAVQNQLDLILVYSLEFTAGVSVLSPDAIEGRFGLDPVATVETGENPQWVAFDPSGETDNLIVTNAGDNTVSLLGTPTIRYLAGRVTADCPEAGTPLPEVEVDVYATWTGDLVASLTTDANGEFAISLDPGEYVVTLVTPLGYNVASEELYLDVTGGEADPTRADFDLICESVVPDPRKMSFWKHQLGLNLLGDPDGEAEVDAAALCSYLDIIAEHFHNHRINPVETYVPPESGLCEDKLQVAKDLLNLRGKLSKHAQARQELLALLFNVASGQLSLLEVVSMDGAKVSHVITFVDGLIDDGDPDNDHLAWNLAKDVNKGKVIDAGVIPTDLPDIIYKDGVPARYELMQNFPNPFNPVTRIFFALPQRTRVGLVIYDAAGRRVRVLVKEELDSGLHSVLWDGQNERGRRVASGVYFYRLVAGDFEQTRKMLLLK